jgi:hypothetical protein
MSLMPFHGTYSRQMPADLLGRTTAGVDAQSRHLILEPQFPRMIQSVGKFIAMKLMRLHLFAGDLSSVQDLLWSGNHNQ